MHFGLQPRFEIEADGTIVARAGTQTNCAGIAAIRVRITPIAVPGLVCLPLGAECDRAATDGMVVPGVAVPAVYRAAVFQGAGTAYAELGLTEGIQFELVDALVHAVDANERKFVEVGKSAVVGWVKLKNP